MLDFIQHRLLIPAGKATGFIGRSGAGKTTIVQLLTRLMEPSEGGIWVDDIALRDIDPASWRSRIAVARAILCEPEILVLDEATNAVDDVSETAILETIKARSGHCTTLLISHHHRIISVCDRVVVLNTGRVSAAVDWSEVEHLRMEERYELGSSTLELPT